MWSLADGESPADKAAMTRSFMKVSHAYRPPVVVRRMLEKTPPISPFLASAKSKAANVLGRGGKGGFQVFLRRWCAG